MRARAHFKRTTLRAAALALAAGATIPAGGGGAHAHNADLAVTGVMVSDTSPSVITFSIHTGTGAGFFGNGLSPTPVECLNVVPTGQFTEHDIYIRVVGTNGRWFIRITENEPRLLGLPSKSAMYVGDVRGTGPCDVPWNAGGRRYTGVARVLGQ